MESQALADWSRRFSAAVAAALREFSPRLQGVSVIRFAVDCGPWSGVLGVAILTAAEADADGAMLDSAEMAAWRYYDFAQGLAAWRPIAAIGRQMRDAYEAAAERETEADAFLMACSQALAGPEVTQAIELLDRDPRFAISVAHPDDGREFFPPH